MVADTLTKALLSAKTKHFANELGLAHWQACALFFLGI
jgi:hypothetical protein